MNVPLVDKLRVYQGTIGNCGAWVDEHLMRLERPGAQCVVAGQQVGFATGPIYTILKAQTCLAEAKARGAVPIFWAHTEDHDVEEVAGATVLSEGGDLHRYRVRLPPGCFVEDLPWLAEYEEKLAAFMRAVQVPAEVWQRAVAGASRYAEVMIRLMVYLFAGSGLLFVEPKLFRPRAGDFFAAELRDAARWRSILQKEAGTMLSITDEQTNLFFKDDRGKRLKIYEREGEFVIGGRAWSLSALLSLPAERFSCGVAARPLLQDTLLPTVAVVAGPTERRYLRMLSGYYRARGVSMPEIVPRCEQTFVPDAAQRWLAQLGVEAEELAFSVEGMQKQRERALAVGLPPHRLHYLRNLLRPHGKPQERVLSWWQFI